MYNFVRQPIPYVDDSDLKEISADIYSRIWHIKFKRISSTYFDIAHSENVVLRSAKWCSML